MRSFIKHMICLLFAAAFFWVFAQQVSISATEVEDYYIKLPKEITIMEGDIYLFEAETNIEGILPYTCNEVIPTDYTGSTDNWLIGGSFEEGSNKFKATTPGKTTVWVSKTVFVRTETHNGPTSWREITVIDYCVVTILPMFTQTILIGNEFHADLTQYPLYAGGSYSVKVEKNDSKKDIVDENPPVEVDENGCITAISAGNANIYITKEGKSTLVAVITVPEGGLVQTNMYRGVGSEPIPLILKHVGGAAVHYSTDNSSVANVDTSGTVTPQSKGKAVITVRIVTTSGKTIFMNCDITVTEPKLNKGSMNLARNKQSQLELTGTDAGSAVEWYTEKSSIVSISGDGFIYALKKGTSIIKVIVDGVELKCTIRVTDPMLKKTELLLVSGKKEAIELKGTNSYSKPIWYSSNKLVATVNKSGIIKTRKPGNTIVTCEVDGIVLYSNICVGKKNAVKAIKAAESVIGSKYSQAKRMSKGYYDCSSLVWRSYSQTGIYFGNKYYAPTAAEIARNMVNNKKSVSLKVIYNTKKLLPGDLLFYTRKPSNGRYKNIYHVAIYCGNNKIIHADGYYVSKVGYWLRTDTVVVARPTK